MAPLTELIEHLERHEGGAVGAARIVFETPGGTLRTGISTDDLLAHLRAVAAGKDSPAVAVSDGTVTVTSRNGAAVGLVKVLGFHLDTFTVAIEATECAKAVR